MKEPRTAEDEMERSFAIVAAVVVVAILGVLGAISYVIHSGLKHMVAH